MLCCYSGRCVWFRVCGVGGAMLTHLDAMLAQLGAMFCHLGGHVGPSWKLCWPILGLCWPSLGLYWPILGAMLLHIESIMVHLEICVGPCWSISSHKEKLERVQNTVKRRGFWQGAPGRI